MLAKDLPYKFNEIEEAPPLILSVYDADEGIFSDSADFLGRSVINIRDSIYTEDPAKIPDKPKWHDIKFGVDPASPACG